MTNEDLAYIAGFFDADGCVCIARSRSKRHSSGVKFTLTATISQKGMMPLFDILLQEFGGSVCEATRAYQWSVASKMAEQFLQTILPFLRKKRQRALIAIAFQHLMSSRRGNQKMAPQIHARYEQFRQAMREANNQ